MSASGFSHSWHVVWSSKYVCILPHVPPLLSASGQGVIKQERKGEALASGTLSWGSSVAGASPGFRGAGWLCGSLLPFPGPTQPRSSPPPKGQTSLGGLPGRWSCLTSQSPVLSPSIGAAPRPPAWKPGAWLPEGSAAPLGVTWLAAVSLLSCLLVPGQTKVFSRCELVKVLQDLGLEGYRGYSLADWVCLAYFASGFDASDVEYEPDGSSNNGIFHINSRKWCRNFDKKGPNLCHVYCTDLLNPNLKDSVICAMKISQETNGLSNWETWRQNCQGQDLSDWVDGCDDF